VYVWVLRESLNYDRQGTYVTLSHVRAIDKGRQQYVPFCFFNGAYVALNKTKGFSVAMEMQQ